MANDIERLRPRVSMFGADQYGRSRQLCGPHWLRCAAAAATTHAARLFRDVLLVINGQRLAFDQRGMFEHRWLFMSPAVFPTGRLLRTCRNLLPLYQWQRR
jgi:hypothetical protein